MRFFSEDDVLRLLPMEDAVARMREAFSDFAAGRAKNQPRRRLKLETGAVLHSMAGAWGGYFGAKIYSTHPAHGAWFTVVLYEAATSRPLAQFEANHLGQIRTGAVSGLAADVLTPQRALRVACIGTGFQARTQLQAIAAVRPLESVKVWSRTASRRDPFALEIADLLRAPVSAAASAADAADGCDILVTATWAKEPVIEAPAVPAGALLVAVGSNDSQRRELPPEIVRNSTVVADDKEACRIEAGDLLLALDDAGWSRVLELRDVVAGTPLPAANTRNTVFKSVGLGLEDVAAAALVYERR